MARGQTVSAPCICHAHAPNRSLAKRTSPWVIALPRCAGSDQTERALTRAGKGCGRDQRLL